MNNEKIFLNLMVDREDSKYTYILATKTDCQKLIADCIKFFDKAYYFENFKEYMTENDNCNEFDNRLLEYIDNNIENDCDMYNGVFMFVQYVLIDSNELLETEEHKIYF